MLVDGSSSYFRNSDLLDVQEEIWIDIFSYLNPRDLSQCLLVSKTWKTLGESDLLWKALYLEYRLGLEASEELEWGIVVKIIVLVFDKFQQNETYKELFFKLTQIFAKSEIVFEERKQSISQGKQSIKFNCGFLAFDTVSALSFIDHECELHPDFWVKVKACAILCIASRGDMSNYISNPLNLALTHDAETQSGDTRLLSCLISSDQLWLKARFTSFGELALTPCELAIYLSCDIKTITFIFDAIFQASGFSPQDKRELYTFMWRIRQNPTFIDQFFIGQSGELV